MKVTRVVQFIPTLQLEWVCTNVEHRGKALTYLYDMPFFNPDNLQANLKPWVQCGACGRRWDIREFLIERLEQDKSEEDFAKSSLPDKVLAGYSETLDRYKEVL